MKRTLIAAWIVGAVLAGLPAAVASADAPGAASVAARLEEAREDLRIGELTLERIEAAFQGVRARPDTDPEVLRDYAIYLERVRSMMEAQRRIVMAMESVEAATLPPPPSSRWPRIAPILFDPDLPESIDQGTALDRELDDTFAAFDEFLREEQYEAARRMEQLDDASSEGMTSLAREAAEAVERLRQQGIDVDTSAPDDGASGGEGPESSGTGGGGGGGSAGTEDGEGADGSSGGAGAGAEETGDEGGGTTADGAGTGDGTGASPGDGRTAGDGAGSASGSGSGSGGIGDRTTGTPGASAEGDDPHAPPVRDRPPAHDDDIVARQLREAAERETDPELKEKLWQEYDRYKRSS